MRVAVFSDVHGNAVALQAMIASARTAGVDGFWVVGDLVANGPQPAEALELLRSLPNLMAVRGNTDRYVLTGDLRGMIPAIDRPCNAEEVDALVAASAAHAWTRGCITVAGHYEWLAGLPLESRCRLPDGTRVLLVHASPGRDDGPGLTVEASEAELAQRGFAECDADLVLTGHTHILVVRTVAGVRLINVGSVSLPTTPRGATWTMIDAGEAGYSIQHVEADYDREAVRAPLASAHHPTTAWLEHKLGLDNPD